MAQFSRLQLAAALIEYDNDPTNPYAPYRSAHDSAIFAHLRRNPRPSLAASRKSTDYLGVNLPSDGGSGGLDSGLGHSRARSSIDALRNPFQGDPAVDEDTLETFEDEEEEEDLEVDLASWGLDTFMPKDKEKGKHKKKEKVNALPNPHPNVQSANHRTARSMSVGNLDSFGAGGAFLDSVPTSAPAPSEAHARRRSLGSALDTVGDNDPQRPPMRQRPQSTHALIESIPVTPPLHAVPFPSQSIRSASPIGDMGGGYSRERSYSAASFGSRGLLNDAEASSSRPLSPAQAGDNPFALRPPSPSRTSRFDPKAAAHARTVSNASLGSRMLLENDGASVFSGHAPTNRMSRPLSTFELLRPKVLVMPSPLQGASAAPQPRGREGFQMDSDGPPLPPGARANTGRRTSQPLLMDLTPPASALIPNPANSFTPNPRSSMTLSQLTFRNQLMVDGQRDIAYTDIDGNLRRAVEDGEQIAPVYPEEEEPARPVTVVVDEPASHGRPVGKLYGKSLIDDLEERKATMRGKSRVFSGDERPSMMARPQMKRSSTLIDLASLQDPRISLLSPNAQSSRPPLGRRASTGPQPLLKFDDGAPSGGRLGVSNTMSKSRSVFGTDMLWQREMEKLKEIEAREAEEQKAREALEAARAEKAEKRKKKKKGKKGKEKEEPSPPADLATSPTSPGVARVSVEPPTLPAIPKNITRGPPPVVEDDDTESSTDSDGAAAAPQAPGRKSTEIGAERWFAGSSDDEKEGPVRTTGVGPRYPKRARNATISRQDDESSEEDLPLAATIDRAVVRATQFRSADDADSSDEDKPLVAVLDKAKSKVPEFSFDNLLSRAASGSKVPGAAPADADDEDEDDKPLGLRASFVPPVPSGGGDDDDDKPLALHPEQQRRTQYMMLQQQQQQQQQQQMMMQAQMQSSMMFANPSFLGSGFFAPPMGPMMMGPMGPPVPASPAPNDSAKFGRVDKWRHDVAVEGTP